MKFVLFLSLTGAAHGFALTQSRTRSSTALSMSEEGPILNKWSRCVSDENVRVACY
jgi:hypothetical protein